MGRGYLVESGTNQGSGKKSFGVRVRDVVIKEVGYDVT